MARTIVQNTVKPWKNHGEFPWGIPTFGFQGKNPWKNHREFPWGIPTFSFSKLHQNDVNDVTS